MPKRLHGGVSQHVFLRDQSLDLSFFLVYIIDLAENFSSQVKLFADDNSVCRIAWDVNVFWQVLSNDLSIIQDWAAGR